MWLHLTLLLLDSRKKRSTSASTLPFIIGEDITCSSLNKDVYCNGPLNPETSYMYDLFSQLQKTKLQIML